MGFQLSEKLFWSFNRSVDLAQAMMVVMIEAGELVQRSERVGGCDQWGAARQVEFHPTGKRGGMFRPPAERGHLETEGRDACDPWQRGMEFCVGHDTWEAMFGRVDGRWNFHSK